MSGAPFQNNDYKESGRYKIITSYAFLNIIPSFQAHSEGLAQDSSNSMANALELLQSRSKPST